MNQVVAPRQISHGRSVDGRLVMTVMVGGQPIEQYLFTVEEEANIKAALSGIVVPQIVLPAGNGKMN